MKATCFVIKIRNWFQTHSHYRVYEPRCNQFLFVCWWGGFFFSVWVSGWDGCIVVQFRRKSTYKSSTLIGCTVWGCFVKMDQNTSHNSSHREKKERKKGEKRHHSKKILSKL